MQSREGNKKVIFHESVDDDKVKIECGNPMDTRLAEVGRIYVPMPYSRAYHYRQCKADLIKNLLIPTLLGPRLVPLQEAVQSERCLYQGVFKRGSTPSS